MMGDARRNALLNMGQTGVVLLVPLITFPYTSRILGPDLAGQLGLASSMAAFAIQVGAFGIPTHGVREIAAARSDESQTSRVLQELLSLQVVAAALATLLFALVVSFVPRFRQDPALFALVGLSIPTTLLVGDWYFQGRQRFDYLAGRNLGISLLTILATFTLVRSTEDFLLCAAIGLLAPFIGMMGQIVAVSRKIRTSLARQLDPSRHLGALATNFLSQTVTSAYLYLDVVLLGLLAPSSSVAFYSVGVKLSRMILFVVTALAATTYPRAVQLLTEGQRAAYERMLTKLIAGTFLLGLPAVAGIVVLRDDLLLVLGGVEYLPASTTVGLSAPSILILGLANVLSSMILLPAKRDGTILWLSVLGAVVTVTLDMILIPGFLHEGCAIAALLGQSVVGIATIVASGTTHKPRWPWRSMLMATIASGAMVAAFLAGERVFGQQDAWLRLMLQTCLGVGVYALTLLLLRDESMEDIRSLVLKILRGRTP